MYNLRLHLALTQTQRLREHVQSLKHQRNLRRRQTSASEPEAQAADLDCPPAEQLDEVQRTPSPDLGNFEFHLLEMSPRRPVLPSDAPSHVPTVPEVEVSSLSSFYPFKR